jgi:hypothetical protein
MQWSIWWDNGTYNTYSSNSTFSINTWYHLALVADTSTDIYYIYKNGVLDASGSIPAARTIGNSDSPLYIGTYGNSATYAWPGKIDDVKIYNYPLTPTQIKTLYNNGAVNFGPSTGTP